MSQITNIKLSQLSPLRPPVNILEALIALNYNADFNDINKRLVQYFIVTLDEKIRKIIISDI